MLFTMNDMMLGVLIAAVVLLVKSLPMLMARISFGYLTSRWLRTRGKRLRPVPSFDVSVSENGLSEVLEMSIHSDDRLAAYKGILDGLKKNVGLYDEALAAAAILALFHLGGYFEPDVEPVIAALVLLTLLLCILFYWAQRKLVVLLNWEVMLRMRERQP